MTQAMEIILAVYPSLQSERGDREGNYSFPKLADWGKYRISSKDLKEPRKVADGMGNFLRHGTGRCLG